jgi:hypothetical protein
MTINNFSINKAFKFGFNFIRKNILFLYIPFILFLFLALLDSFAIKFMTQTYNKYLNTTEILNIMLLRSNLNVAFPYRFFFHLGKVFRFIPLNLILLIAMIILAAILGNLIHILVIKRAIFWRNKFSNKNEPVIRKSFIKTLIKLIIGTIVFAGMITIFYLSSIILVVFKFKYGFISNFSILFFILKIIGLLGAIYIILTFYLYSFFIIDKNCSILESFKKSYFITSGIKEQIFLFFMLVRLIVYFPSYLYLKFISGLFSFPVDILIFSILGFAFSAFAITSYFDVYKQLNEHKVSY